MGKQILGVLFASVFSLGLVSTAQAVVSPLESRLGGLAYYDPNLDITWAADANINGADTWDNQMTWVSGLTINSVTGWRLPSADVNGDATVVNCASGGVAGCSDNEMGFLFWDEGIRATSPGSFLKVQSFLYWAGTEFAPARDNAWAFALHNGGQNHFTKTDRIFAWAVHSGDVRSVPEPTTFALLGLGLAGIGFSKHSKR